MKTSRYRGYLIRKNRHENGRNRYTVLRVLPGKKVHGEDPVEFVTPQPEDGFEYFLDAKHLVDSLVPRPSREVNYPKERDKE